MSQAVPHLTIKAGYKPQAEDTTASVEGQQSQSQKQHRDVLAVLKTQADNLDYTYLQQWAEQLGILAELEQSQVEAGV